MPILVHYKYACLHYVPLSCGIYTLLVCTVASRYYEEKPHIYGMAIHFAKAAAANAIIDGWKTVEMIQAFALWSVYNPPARRWEEDRAWCYTGIAFRYVEYGWHNAYMLKMMA